LLTLVRGACKGAIAQEVKFVKCCIARTPVVTALLVVSFEAERRHMEEEDKPRFLWESPPSEFGTAAVAADGDDTYKYCGRRRSRCVGFKVGVLE
jgi:hypothetical protein